MFLVVGLADPVQDIVAAEVPCPVKIHMAFIVVADMAWDMEVI